jgi:glyoxylase-like metal-dependent hydrolase (beta-lactamase superfamily II)
MIHCFSIKKKLKYVRTFCWRKIVGNKKYTFIEPARFRLDGGAMFGIIPRPLWNKVYPADELNRIELTTRLLLIQTADKNILIDSGIGDYHGKKFDERFAVIAPPSPLEYELQKVGLSADDITDLIISHLHFDHVGGIGKLADEKFIPVMKNATLHLHKSHYEYALAPTERDSGSFISQDFLPIIDFYQKENRIHWLSGMEGEILEGLQFKCSMGHTPFLIHPYDDKYIYLADLIPTSHHIPIPWVMGYDISPGQSTKDKRSFLEFIVLKNLEIVFEHDPLIASAKIKRNSKGDFESL